MSTKPTPPSAPTKSSAIQQSADILVSLIEHEKSKVATEARRDFAELDRRFAAFRNGSEFLQTTLKKQMQERDEKLSKKREEFDQVVSALTKAREDAEAARCEAKEARKELMKLKSVGARKFDLHFHHTQVCSAHRLS
ncbi:hypothetical protein JAAARDRAFT_670026 [Jaapia argillacea MUCL 33604]|uniref:Uncharacterized protein n=1 Tax=Jaapia argillacea MUCL 33604 TaxID=933084 RepID=A0A067PX94_9AGAM|nr:hypothetical protein JAAARDRAFT_670026 [Jaapia argillacea MUCL 33604]